MKVFGLARSVGIVKDEETATSKSSPWGMAALITCDGYAITANHVVESESPGVIASKDKGFFVPAHIGTLQFTLRGSDGSVKEHSEKPGGGYFAYKGEKKVLVDSTEIVIEPLRVVKRFKTIDLAIVKTEITVSNPFEFSELAIEKNILFTSGNPFRERGSTAGEVIRTKLRGGVDTFIHTSMPMNPAQSGSPVFDQHGKLVGTVTKGVPKGLLFLPASIAGRVDPDIIAKAIIKDRIQNPEG